MNWKKIFFLILVIIFTLAACQESEIPSTGKPTLEIIRLQITPGLAHWLDDVSACANTLTNLGIVTDIRPKNALDLVEADLILRLGSKEEDDPFVAVMGIETIVIIAGDAVPVTSLSNETVRAIFSGRLQDWMDVPEVPGEEIENNLPIKILSYPEGHDIEIAFEETFLDGERITADSFVFSTVDYLASLMQENPAAIGYTLGSQIPDTANSLVITGIDPSARQHHVLAITSAEPQGTLRTLLLCLQNAQ